MAYDVLNDIQQLDQIDSELNATEYTDSAISNLDQVDSDMEAVVAVDISGSYLVDVSADEWVLESGKYYYTILATEHRLLHPFIDCILVLNGDNYDYPVYSYSRLPNGNIRIISDINIACEIKLSGDRQGE